MFLRPDKVELVNMSGSNYNNTKLSAMSVGSVSD